MPKRVLGVRKAPPPPALLLGSAVMLFPLVWDGVHLPQGQRRPVRLPARLIPDAFVWSNYRDVFVKQNMLEGLANSLNIAAINTAGTLFFASLAAYAFAKLRFPFKRSLFLILIATMMIPGQVTLIPMFIIFRQIGWIDTHLPLIVPSILCNAYGVFMIRQFFSSVPDSFAESAFIDGCGQFRIYLSIMLPMALPALVALGLFNFMGSWNSFLPPLIYLNSSRLFTLPLVIMSFKSRYFANWSLLTAAACVGLFPVIVLYLAAQRYFIDGIMIGGIKG